MPQKTKNRIAAKKNPAAKSRRRASSLGKKEERALGDGPFAKDLAPDEREAQSLANQPETPPAAVGDPNDVRTEHALRNAIRPHSPEEREGLLKQLMRATLKVRSLQEQMEAQQKQKNEVIKDYKERVEVQQIQANTAATELERGGFLRTVRCECTWDLATKTYKEVAEDTREVVTSRPLTDEEIVRFTQIGLPGTYQESWLTGEQALARMGEDDPEEPEDGEDRDPDEEEES